MDVVRKRIYFVLPSLSGGGAEKVMLTLLRHMDRKKFDPTLVLVKKEGQYIDAIPSDIEVIDLNVSKARYALFKLFRQIHVSKPDIVFSTLGHLNLLVALLKPLLPSKTRFVSRESNTVSMENREEKYPKLFDFLYRHVYNRFDLIIAQAHYMKEDLVTNFHIDPDKIKVIYNPVDKDAIEAKLRDIKDQSSPKKHKKIIAVGRLSRQKGFDLLIEAMALLEEAFVLEILGDGEERGNLERQIMELGLEKRVTLLPFQQNPYKFMRQSDLLVLSSRYEGLPNVLLEAGICGLPVVAMDTPGGTKELVIESKTGVMVEVYSAVALAEAIQKATQATFNKDFIKILFAETYNIEKIVTSYENVLLEENV